MQVDNALLTKLEKLSFLKISEDKREEVISQLSEIVSFVNNLNELNTDGINGSFAMSDRATYTREDTPFCDKKINEDILEHAPQSDDSFFIVPKIIE